ncbi:MAG: hypothetical protein CL885_00870 [Dehalococcoidia bacterium]|nr:hypothetical protein [Dehalococcoidia bacterium]
MKLFRHATYKPHQVVAGGKQYSLILDGGLELSAIQGMGSAKESGIYGNVFNGTFEVAVFDDNDETLPLSASSDTLSYQTEEEIDQLLTEIQNNRDAFFEKIKKDRHRHMKEMES